MPPLTRCQALAGAAGTLLFHSPESFAMTAAATVIVNARVTTSECANLVAMRKERDCIPG